RALILLIPPSASLSRSFRPFCLARTSSLTALRPPPFFFFTDTPTTESSTLSLHDALPISPARQPRPCPRRDRVVRAAPLSSAGRSEEHTSELQSLTNLVCRLLLEKKKNN